MRPTNLLKGIALSCGIALFCYAPLSADHYIEAPICENTCGEFNLYGEFLYWKAIQEEMQYAASLPNVDSSCIGFVNGMGDVFQKIKIVDPRFSFEPGFRIGLGYEAAESNWDVQLFWTRLHEHQHSHVRQTASIIPLTVPTSSSFGLFCNEAKSHWHFELDTVDFQIGKTCSFFDCFGLRPYLGVKIASVRQSQHIDYLGFTLSSIPVEVSNSKRNDFKGIGPSFGLDSSWLFLSDWRLTGGISGAILCGEFDVFSRPSILFFGDALAFDIKNDKKQRLRPVIDARLGLDWKSCFSGGTHINLGVFYEVHYWWNQWQAFASDLSTLSTGGATPQGDLMMHGVTAHLGISF